MDDFQVVLYIVFGVIYVLSRVLKKKKQAQPRNMPKTTSHEIEPEVEKSISFEDLLQEITGTKSSESEPAPNPNPNPTPNANPYQIHDTPKPLTAIEKQNAKMGSQEKELKPLVESTPIQEGQSILHHDPSRYKGFERFGAFEIEEETESEFITFLYEEDGPKKAFVLSEIFNRKY